jgi:hypothetical protein
LVFLPLPVFFIKAFSSIFLNYFSRILTCSSSPPYSIPPFSVTFPNNEYDLKEKRRTRGLNRFCPEVGVGNRSRWEGPNNVYTCK